jgi:hypothetical protein
MQQSTQAIHECINMYLHVLACILSYLSVFEVLNMLRIKIEFLYEMHLEVL